MVEKAQTMLSRSKQNDCIKNTSYFSFFSTFHTYHLGFLIVMVILLKMFTLFSLKVKKTGQDIKSDHDNNIFNDIIQCDICLLSVFFILVFNNIETDAVP